MTDLPTPDWSELLRLGRNGEVPCLHLGQSAASVAKSFGGKQPVYLATPYSREAVDVLGCWSYQASNQAKRRAARACADLLNHGVTAISPVVLAVAMINATGAFGVTRREGFQFVPRLDPLDGGLWYDWCQPLLSMCGAVAVPDVPGWQDSNGIYAEVAQALTRNIPVYIYGGAA